MTWKQYSHHEMHELLCEKFLSDKLKDHWIAGQALLCPYYVPLEGKLGFDWGVILNPESPRFGMLTYEHSDCECPDRELLPGSSPEEGPVHIDAPNQEGDMWDQEWKHVCDDLCDDPCEYLSFNEN